MAVLRTTETKHVEKFNVDRQACEPFFAADNHRRAHEMVVNRVREVVSGNAVRLQNNDVLVVFGYGDIPLDFVTECDFVFRVALRTKTDNVRLLRFQVCVDFFFRQVTASRVFAVVTRDFLFRRLLFAKRGKFVFRTEARVRQTALN